MAYFDLISPSPNPPSGEGFFKEFRILFLIRI